MSAISIIIPVYNTEKFINRCIDSILAQTFTNFELLIIDDGSKDGSGRICDGYAANDIRVRVFHKENGGVSSARNLGLEYARNEWIMFVDSDDWLPQNSLEILIQGQEADLIVSGYVLEKEKTKPIVPSCNGIQKGEGLHNFIIKNYQSTFLTAPWAKLYRREIIVLNAISFDLQLKVCEDAIFIATYLLYVDSICIVDKACYVYDTPADFGEKYTGLLAKDMDRTFYLYDVTRKAYDKLNKHLNVTSIKSDCSIIFGLLENAVLRYNHNKEALTRFCLFVNDTYVAEALKKKQQNYIYGLLWISKLRIPYVLYWYMKFAHALHSIVTSFG